MEANVILAANGTVAHGDKHCIHYYNKNMAALTGLF